MDSRAATFVGCFFLGIAASAFAADLVPGVTVEAERQRTQLRHDVDAFVASSIVLAHTDDQTIERWTYKPICPMVAGLTQQQGEFVLGRISKIAAQAGAPLASTKCRSPNLFVIVTSDPASLIKKLESTRSAFNREMSARQKTDFERDRPVRTWYNAGTVSLDGTLVIEMLDTSSSRARNGSDRNGQTPVFNNMPSQYGSRLNASTVTHDILSVIEIVDRRSTVGLNMNQLADYVAVAGLAQVDLDKDLGSAPTILNVFRAPADAKASGATSWDIALLTALYKADRSKTMALSEIQGMVLASVSQGPRSEKVTP